MLKITAMVLLGSGFAFGGRYLAAQYVKKSQIISDILLMISVIETQLRYACLPVSDLLRILCNTDKLKNLGFLENCRYKVSCGEPFPVAWKTAVKSEPEFCGLLGDYCNYLVQLGADIGSTDIEGQLSCCEYYKQIFEKELVLREENRKKYSKLYPTLGVMLGISAAIIIV